MNSSEIIEKIKPSLEKTLKFFEEELAKIRSSRLSPASIEDLKVNYLENQYLLKQLASVSSASAQNILVHPWDKTYLPPIISAIEKSNLGLSISVDKETINLRASALSLEYRKDLLKILSKQKESVRETIRHFRDKIWDEIQEYYKKGEIREDDKFKGKEKLQKLIDEYNKKIEELTQRKEKEILG